MVASLLRVLCSGLQDERLAFRPTLFPFQRVWRATGRFTTQWVRLDFDNVPAFGGTGIFRLTRKGHLVTRLFLVAELPDLWSAQRRAAAALAGGGSGAAWPRFGWTNSLGHALIRELTLDISSARVETLDGQAMEMLDEFYTPFEKVGAANEGLRRAATGFGAQTWGWPPAAAVDAVGGRGYNERVVVPLPFWFSRGDIGCALPIDAMGVDEVRCGVGFRALAGLYTTTSLRAGAVDAVDGGVEGSGLVEMAGSRFYASSDLSGAPLADAGGVIQMPNAAGLGLGECYVMAEYVYLDQNEANRFRLADLQVPVVQHQRLAPVDSRGVRGARVSLEVAQPARTLMFSCQPWEAPAYNAHFLATREMTGTVNTLPDGSSYPWWPDADAAALRPGFALSDSEPVAEVSLEYQGLVRYRSAAGSLFRTVVPCVEARKAPWINRYYYYFPFGVRGGFTPFSQPRGEANWDRMTRKELVLAFRELRGGGVGRYWIHVLVETYNVLRVFGGRAGMLF